MQNKLSCLKPSQWTVCVLPTNVGFDSITWYWFMFWLDTVHLYKEPSFPRFQNLLWLSVCRLSKKKFMPYCCCPLAVTVTVCPFLNAESWLPQVFAPSSLFARVATTLLVFSSCTANDLQCLSLKIQTRISKIRHSKMDTLYTFWLIWCFTYSADRRTDSVTEDQLWLGKSSLAKSIERHRVLRAVVFSDLWITLRSYAREINGSLQITTLHPTGILGKNIVSMLYLLSCLADPLLWCDLYIIGQCLVSGMDS